MEIVKAPNKYSANDQITSLFLAGSIEMGVAELWQDKVTEALKDTNVLILNPRRDDWDSSWKQTIDDPQFREQVEWELTALERSSVILMYFDPATKSPISLLELGLHASSGKLLVCCPDGFWRKGNVEVVCNRYGIPLYNELDEVIKILQRVK